jgi:hypothetical protein
MNETEGDLGSLLKNESAGTGSPNVPGGRAPAPSARSAPPLLTSPEEEIIAFSPEEYAGALRQPQRTIEYVLGSSGRLARSVCDGGTPWRLAFMLLTVSLLAAIPYGIVAPHSGWWKIAALYCGSLAICFPSLHIFAQFFSVRLELLRSLALAMIITATSAFFALGFSPIVWFLKISIVPREQPIITPYDLSIFLLYVSLILGLVQIMRCLIGRGFRQAHGSPLLILLVVLWAPLLIFITHRMSMLLESPK